MGWLFTLESDGLLKMKEKTLPGEPVAILFAATSNSQTHSGQKK